MSTSKLRFVKRTPFYLTDEFEGQFVVDVGLPSGLKFEVITTIEQSEDNPGHTIVKVRVINPGKPDKQTQFIFATPEADNG